MSLLLILFLASCSEKEITPDTKAAKNAVEDDQPPKSNCSGNPDCH